MNASERARWPLSTFLGTRWATDSRGPAHDRRTTAVVEAGGVLGELACAPPLTLRQVHGADRCGQGRCELCLVGTAAGPLAGDDLSICLTLRPGARAAPPGPAWLRAGTGRTRR